MKNTKQIESQISNQQELVDTLKKEYRLAYKNYSDNMLSVQAEFFIAEKVLKALKSVLPTITDNQDTIDFYK